MSGTNHAVLTIAKEAAIPIFSAGGSASSEQPTTYNDDLRLGSFRSSRYAWPGEQRRGILMHIDDSSPVDEHLRWEVAADFCLPDENPLPQEIATSIRIVSESDHNALL